MKLLEVLPGDSKWNPRGRQVLSVDMRRAAEIGR